MIGILLAAVFALLERWTASRALGSRRLLLAATTMVDENSMRIQITVDGLRHRVAQRKDSLTQATSERGGTKSVADLASYAWSFIVINIGCAFVQPSSGRRQQGV